MRGALVLLLAASILPSCSTPEEAKSASQMVDENSDVLRQLASWEDAEQKKAIGWVRSRGKDRGTAFILYILNDPKFENYRAEVVLARILADWKDPRAIGFLLPGLKVGDAGAARIASEGLIALGENAAVITALEEMLTSPVARERALAAGTLAKIGGPRVQEMFGARLKGEVDPEIRAIYLLEIIGGQHPRRKEILIDALTDADAAIRAEAWKALRKYPGLPVQFAPDGPLEERARDVAALRIWVRAGKR